MTKTPKWRALHLCLSCLPLCSFGLVSGCVKPTHPSSQATTAEIAMLTQSKKSIDELLEQRIVTLDGEINDKSTTEVIAKLLFLSHEDKKSPIVLEIDSPGGSVTAGMAIIDTIKDLETPVHTSCRRHAQGMAAAILASGRLGSRSVAKTAVLSIMEAFSGTSEMKADDLKRTNVLIANILADRSGKPKDVVLQDMRIARRFSTKEAIEYGLADKLID